MYVDFSKAYDKIPRQILLQELKAAGCGKRFLYMIKGIYKCTKFLLKSATIPVSMGVKQGAPMSCLLFVFYVDIKIRKINRYDPDGYLGVLNVMLLMDDTVILATSREACIAKFSLLVEYCDNYGMKINNSKTQFMVINAEPADKRTIRTDHLDVQYCKEYWYLGSPITDDGSPLTVMRAHIKARSKHVLKFITFLQKNPDMPFSAKKAVAESCIVSAILYGTETWLTSSFKPLEVLYNRVIKALLGVRISTPNDLCYFECGVSRLRDRILKSRSNFMVKRVGTAPPDEPISIAHMLIGSVRSPRYRSFRQFETYQETDMRQHIISLRTKSRFNDYCNLNPLLVVHRIYSAGIPDSLRIAYSRLILSSHRLRSETGRWTRPATPRENRLCNCGMHIQDEVHMLTQCEKTVHLRDQYNTLNMSINDIMQINPHALGTFIATCLKCYI